jgi:hypothetical protein
MTLCASSVIEFPKAISPVCGSMAICPEVKITSPQLTPALYGPMAGANPFPSIAFFIVFQVDLNYLNRI